MPQTQASATLFQQGLKLHQQGQLSQAKAVYEEVLRMQPAHSDALHLLGAIAAQSHNPALAVELIGQAIAIHPGCADAHSNLAAALLELQRLEEALVSCDRAIALRPDYADAHYNRGLVLHKLQRNEEALASFSRAVDIQPDHARAWFSRGNLQQELQRLEPALASYDQALAIQPDHAEACVQRGMLLLQRKRPQEALVSLERAIAIKPEHVDAQLLRGNAFMEMQQWEQAQACFDRVIALKPDYAGAYCNHGTTLLEQRQLDAALRSYNQAIALKPDLADAHHNKSIVLLLSGAWQQGLELYEWRWKSSLGLVERPFSQVRWAGAKDQNITGKTILLHGEQGLGDSIQFCRYASLVKQLGARVLLEVPRQLSGLLAGLEGVDAVLEFGQPLPDFDYHCPLMSLPLAFKTEVHRIPQTQPYLRSHAEKRSQWSQRLGRKTRPRLGLVWRGSTVHKDDQNRSLPLAGLWAGLLPLLSGNFEGVSLQKEVRPVDQALLRDSTIQHFGEQLQDFTDTAALCDLMDIVVSVDTSVAHLAAAMGKPTWILLPYVPDWRWLLERDDSPWYPSVRLYRQSQRGQWGPVLERVAQDLQSSLPYLETSA